MKLGIDTSAQNRRQPGSGVSVVLPKEIVSPVKEHPAEEAAAMAEVPEAPVTKGEMRNSVEEPMSALLRRRAEDWGSTTTGRIETAKPAPKEKAPDVVQIADSAALKNLQVAPQKVFSLFEDCPASPKRALRRSMTGPFQEGTGGSGGTG